MSGQVIRDEIDPNQTLDEILIVYRERVMRWMTFGSCGEKF